MQVPTQISSLESFLLAGFRGNKVRLLRFRHETVPGRSPQDAVLIREDGRSGRQKGGR